MENNRLELIEKIQGTIDAEYSFATCCRHLASLIKNGRIRGHFLSFVDTAEANLKLLFDYLEGLGVNNFVLKDKCQFCKITPESFSLIGAINFSLEILSVAERNYKGLVAKATKPGDDKLFRELLKEKIAQKDLLKKEKKFNEERTDRFNTIEKFCIPHVISRLQG